MTDTAPDVVRLRRDQLHGSLEDPLLDSMNFLNEVVLRFPDAISFAPGRPQEAGFEPGAIAGHLERYYAYLRDELGYSTARIRTLMFQYGRTNGLIGELVARTVKNDEDIDVAPEAVVVTAGCQEAMLLVARALCRTERDVMLAASPCYVGLTGAARVLDVDVVPVPEGHRGVEPSTLAASVREVRAGGRRPRALYAVPDFANPSGVSLPTSQRRELLAAAGREDILIVEDNPYGFFAREGERRPTLKSLDVSARVIYLGSFSKTCLPGARVGYVLADQQVVGADGGTTLLAEELSKLKSMTTLNTSTVSQAVIGGMLLEHDCRLLPANAPNVRLYRANLDAMLGALDKHLPPERRRRLGLRWNVPDGGFFLVIDVPFVADFAALERSARDWDVLWMPMSPFYLGRGGLRQLRLSCSALGPAQIDEGIRRLADFIASEADREAGAADGDRPAATPPPGAVPARSPHPEGTT